MNSCCNETPITIQKTAAGSWDVSINWSLPSRELGDDIIASSSWVVEGYDSTLQLYDQSISSDKLFTTTWFRGGTLGNYYTVTNTIITEGARTLTGTFIVQIVPYVYLVQPRVI